MGLVNIHNYLTGADTEYDEKLPAEIAALAAAGDAMANRTFEIFVDIYGSEAGNMALRVLARGGVFLAGGVAARNVDRFTDGRFSQAFLRKGRFEPVLAEIPVDLITNPKVGLRVYVYSGGCSGYQYGMMIEDSPTEEDKVLQANGVTVYVDGKSVDLLRGAQIDYVDTLMGGGFTVNNPNAVAACGCGTSFRTADDAGSPKGCAH